MSGALAGGRRRRKSRLRSRGGCGGDSAADRLDVELPLEVEINEEEAWCQPADKMIKLATTSRVIDLSPDGPDDVCHQSEFVAVLTALQAQTDLGLRLNEKGSQICQLSWAEFSQRVPYNWTDRYPNVCPLCKKKLSSRFSLSRHYIDVHHREEKKLPPPAPCRFCSKILYNQSTLNRHVLTVHKERAAEVGLAAVAAPGRPAVAAVVAAVVAVKSATGVGSATTTATTTTPVSDGGFYCALCQRRHSRQSEVARHAQLLQLQGPVGRHVTSDPPRTAAAPAAGPSDSASSADDSGSAADCPAPSPTRAAGTRTSATMPPFPCSVCHKSFADQERLIAHLSGHLRERHSDALPSGLCPLCELTVPQLTSHIRDAHCRVCARCGLILPEALMERHLTAHDLKMAFWCPVCGQREDRRQRMMQHISERHEFIAEGSQFQCGTCGHVRSQNLVTHCLKHARDDALTAYWFKTDVLSPLEQRGLEAGRLLRSSCEDASLQWLPVSAAEPAATAAGSGSSSVSVHLLQASDGVPGAGLDAAALLSAALCPVCAGPTPSGRQLGSHLQRHGELPLLFCPGCPRTFCRPAPARRHRCAHLLCLLCGLQVAPRHVAQHWALHAGDDPVCALLTPPPPPPSGREEDVSGASDEEPPCGLLERQLARHLAGGKDASAPRDTEEVSCKSAPAESEDGASEGDSEKRSTACNGTEAEANGTKDASRPEPLGRRVKNGNIREENGGELRDRPERRGAVRGARSQSSQSDSCDQKGPSEASENDASDVSSQVEDSPVREPGVDSRSPPCKRRSSSPGGGGGGGGGSSSPGGRSRQRSPSCTFRGGAESDWLSCDLCTRQLRSVSQLRRHRLHRHGEWRGPLRCTRCPRRFFVAAHRRLHACSGDEVALAARPGCRRCGAESAAGRRACLVSAAGRRLRLAVCVRCDCPLPGPDGDDDDGLAGGGSQLSPPLSPPGAAVCGECDAPLSAGAAALLQLDGASEVPGPAAARLCVPCAEQRLAAEPWLAARLWRPEATLGALWCPSCCQPQVSLHQLRLHSLRQHAGAL